MTVMTAVPWSVRDKSPLERRLMGFRAAAYGVMVDNLLLTSAGSITHQLMEIVGESEIWRNGA